MPQRLRRSSPWLNRSGAEADLKELNGRTRAKLARYSTRTAAPALAGGTYDRIMTDV
jgi:hypothetical protein